MKEFELLYKNLTNRKFLSNEALGGEIPFYIFPYDIKNQYKVYDNKNSLITRLKTEGISVFEINLFDLSIDLLKERGVFEKLIIKEPNLTKKQLLDTFHMVLDIEKVSQHIERIVNNNFSDILFLSGVGEVYPFIRSHLILNHLQNKIKDRPVVMFYPGVYSKDLSLFGLIKEDNYYRAFNLNNLNL